MPLDVNLYAGVVWCVTMGINIAYSDAFFTNFVQLAKIPNPTMLIYAADATDRTIVSARRG